MDEVHAWHEPYFVVDVYCSFTDNVIQVCDTSDVQVILFFQLL